MLTSVMTYVVPMAGWSITNLLKGAGSTLLTWIKIVIIIIGMVMLFVGAWQIGKNLMTHGKGQQNSWVVAIALIIVGGLFAVGGWTSIGNFAAGANQTIEDLGTQGEQTKEFKSDTVFTETIVPGYNIWLE